MDPRLLEFDENEATRVIGMALLCTQASPMMRPPMSRVVAMLAGDIEVGAVTSKPSYLTEYNFKDVTSNLFSQEDTLLATTSGNSLPKPQDGNTTNVNITNDPMLSPTNITKSMISDIIGEGR